MPIYACQVPRKASSIDTTSPTQAGGSGPRAGMAKVAANWDTGRRERALHARHTAWRKGTHLPVPQHIKVLEGLAQGDAFLQGCGARVQPARGVHAQRKGRQRHEIGRRKGRAEPSSCLAGVQLKWIWVMQENDTGRGGLAMEKQSMQGRRATATDGEERSCLAVDTPLPNS